VVLLTDGENNAGAIHPIPAAAALARAGVALYVIAVGTSGEVPIDYIDPFTSVRHTGSFDSRFNTTSLANIAASAAGVFIPAPSDDALAQAFSRVGDAEMTISRAAVRNVSESAYAPPLVFGLCALTAAFFFRRLVLGAFL
jgi:Ca-activated chloride channel family protein